MALANCKLIPFDGGRSLSTASVFVCSFESISCIAESNSLSELALDNNPLAQELNYKQTILRHVQQLKQLDMKRISVNNVL